MRLPNHLYDEARSLAAFCGGTALLIMLGMIPFYSAANVHEESLLVGGLAFGAAGMLVLTNALAFARQGGFRRGLPQVLGAGIPFAFTVLFAGGSIPLPGLVAALSACIPWWLVMYVLGYGVSKRLNHQATMAVTVSTWTRRKWGINPALETAGSLLSFSPQSGPWWSGSIAECPATFASRLARFEPVAANIGITSLVANVIRGTAILLITRQVPEDDHSELLARPATWFTVQLPDSAADAPDFRVASRRWTDRDFVYTNVDDYTEVFESIDLQRHYAIRLRRGTDRLRAWQAFNVQLITQLIDFPHLVIAKEGCDLVVMRLHGAESPSEVDRLHAFTETLVRDVIATV